MLKVTQATFTNGVTNVLESPYILEQYRSTIQQITGRNLKGWMAQKSVMLWWTMFLEGIHWLIWCTCRWNLWVFSHGSTAPISAAWPPWLSAINAYSKSRWAGGNPGYGGGPHFQLYIPEPKALFKSGFCHHVSSVCSLLSSTKEPQGYFLNSICLR